MGTDATRSLDVVARRQVRVLHAPLASVTELVFDAFHRSLGTPEPWLRPVRSALAGAGPLLGPLFGPDGPRFVPPSLLPVPDAARSSFAEERGRLAELGADELQAELETAGLTSTAWGIVARHPRPWLDAYLRTVDRVWVGVRPLWDRTAPLVEREAERVGAAMVRGGFDQVLAGLYHWSVVADDRWYIRRRSGPATLAAELRLQPLLVGRDAALIGEADGAVDYLAYPVPGTRHLDLDRGSSPPTGLVALLGEPRARILRRLDHPVPAGRLADHLHLSPSVITHHLEALERAGLARRERAGRQVLVHRRARGTHLLHLYE